MNKLHPVHIKEISQFFEEFEPDYFLTLNFSINYQVTRDRAIKELKRFINKVNNFLFGRKSSKVIKIMPVLEMGADGDLHIGVSENKIRTNWHFHLLIEDPFKRSDKVKEYSFLKVKEIIADIWGASDVTDSSYTSRSEGAAWFQPVSDPLQIVKYIYKETGCVFKESYRNFNELAVLYELSNKEGLK